MHYKTWILNQTWSSLIYNERLLKDGKNKVYSTILEMIDALGVIYWMSLFSLWFMGKFPLDPFIFFLPFAIPQVANRV